MKFLSDGVPYSKAGKTLSSRARSIPQDCQHENARLHAVRGMYICNACGVELHAMPQYCSHLAVNEETMVCERCCTRPEFRVAPHCEHKRLAYSVIRSQLYCLDCRFSLPHDSIPREELSQLKKVAFAQRQARMGRPASIREQEAEEYLMASMTRNAHTFRDRTAVYLHGRVAKWIADPIPLPMPTGAKKTDPVKVSLTFPRQVLCCHCRCH